MSETVKLVWFNRLDDVLIVTVVKRDEQGRLTEGWVENRRFTIRADHDRGVYWQAEFPRLVVKTTFRTGWGGQ